MKDYTVIDDSIRLNTGEFSGVTYRYGRVKLDPDEVNDVLKISFDYDIIDGQVDNVEEFKAYIGPILTEMIDTGLMTNSIVYSGGIDEV
jgi:hypothetical protein